MSGIIGAAGSESGIVRGAATLAQTTGAVNIGDIRIEVGRDTYDETTGSYGAAWNIGETTYDNTVTVNFSGFDGEPHLQATLESNHHDAWVSGVNVTSATAANIGVACNRQNGARGVKVFWCAIGKAK